MAQRRLDSCVVEVAEYLRLEDMAGLRHEFVDGRMYALAPASSARNQIVVNIVASVRPQVRGTQCRIFASDMRLRASNRLYYYPDVMIVCDPSDDEPNVRSHPCALIGVLSPLTAHIDQREKVLAYKQIPSLMVYLIVHQSEPFIEHHYRIDGDIWGIAELERGSELAIPCPDIRIGFDETYEDVTFESS